MDITYIGNSNELLEYLLDEQDIEVKSVLTTKGYLEKRILDYIKKKSSHLIEVANKSDIIAIDENILSSEILMFKFGYILPDTIVNTHSVYNIHPGDLRTNRGAHPIRWSILLGEPNIFVTLYQITGLDEGYVIAEHLLELSENDDYVSANRKVDGCLPLIVDELKHYISDKKSRTPSLVESGNYRKKVCEKDYQIDLLSDDFITMRRKINSVIDFGGALTYYNGEKIRISDIALENQDIISDGELKITTKRGEKVVLTYSLFIWK